MATCKQCKGLGMMRCSLCRGEGELEDGPCKNCDGEGEVVCDGCWGYGDEDADDEDEESN